MVTTVDFSSCCSLCAFMSRSCRRWITAEAASSFEFVDASCSFGAGVSLVDGALQPAAVESAFLLKIPCCLASLPHLASAAGNAARLEAAGGRQLADSWPQARIDRLGISWRHASAHTNACERMESAGAARRSARVCVPRTVTVWPRCLGLLLVLLGSRRHVRRNIRPC